MPEAQPNNPTISIIIPNLNSPIIDDVILAIKKQQLPPHHEILVIGKDKWNKTVQFEDVQFIDTGKPVGAAEARNIGIQNATGKWLFFVDADCIVMEGWLEAFTKDLQEGWAVIGGGVKSTQKPFWGLVYNLAMFHEQLWTQESSKKKFLPTLNLVVKREVIQAAGLLDESRLRGQDVEWTSRMTKAGFELLFEPAAVIEHHPDRSSFASLKDYFYRTGYYSIQTRYQHPEVFNMPGLLKCPVIWILLSPFIAGLTTLKIIFKTKEIRKNFSTIPFIWLLKLIWCLGAAKGLKENQI